MTPSNSDDFEFDRSRITQCHPQQTFLCIPSRFRKRYKENFLSVHREFHIDAVHLALSPHASFVTHGLVLYLDMYRNEELSLLKNATQMLCDLVPNVHTNTNRNKNTK